MQWSDEQFGFETRAIHAGQAPDSATGAVITPVYMTSTYAHTSPGEHKGYEYSRSNNPTRTAFETCVANLESARFGFAFASGCVGATTLIHLLKQGDHVVCCDDMYGGTYRLFEQVFRPHGITFSYADLSVAGTLEAELTEQTRFVWLESPSNPLMKLVDIRRLSQIAHDAGARVVVDNTFLSPYFQKPIELGADLVLHSTTKYINGHSDLIGGVVVTDDEDLGERLSYLHNTIGGIQGAMDAYLCLRSLKTLAVRMQAHQSNAMAVAAFLEGHPGVDRVIYPGLASHPQHELACRQTSGHGGMLSCYLKGDLHDAKHFLEKVQIFTLAESLGGVESLIEHPMIMTHASLPAEVKQKLGINDSLIRMSVGIETEKDLLADLDQALS